MANQCLSDQPDFNQLSTNRKQDMSEQQQPIPVFIRIICPTCGRKGVAEQDKQVICESCVNEFLARNVGIMQPEEPPVPPSTSVKAGEFISKQD